MQFRETIYSQVRPAEKMLSVESHAEAFKYACNLFHQDTDAVSIMQTIFKNGKSEISICTKRKLIIKIQSL